MIRQCGGPDLSNAYLLHDVAHGLSLHDAWQPRSPPFEQLHSVSFRFFSMKTAFLLFLELEQQRSEVHALSGAKHDTGFWKDKSIQIEFLPEFLAKN